MNIKIALLVVSVGLSSPAIGQLKLYSFTTTAEFVSQCGVSSPPSDCLNAVEHVEEVVDNGGNPKRDVRRWPECNVQVAEQR